MIHFNLYLAVHIAVAFHCAACNVAGFGKSIGSFPVYVGDDGVHGLSDLFNLPADGIGYHTDGFREAHMAGQLAGFHAFLEFFNGKTYSLLLHYSGTEGREAVDPPGSNVIHGFAATCHNDHKKVHDETRIDAGAENGYSVGFGNLIQLLCKLRFLSLRICHFFRAGDAVDLSFQDEFDALESVPGKGIGA